MNKRVKRFVLITVLVLSTALLLCVLILLRFTLVTDYFYHSMVKDPARTPPKGNVIVAPADGTVLYVKRVLSGVIPEVVKRGVPVPLEDHIKGKPSHPLKDGYLVGIFMNSQGVHINRAPDSGTVRERYIFNGPHMDMTETEKEVILSQLIPGTVFFRKLLGMAPFSIENKADYVTKSARETLFIEHKRGSMLIVIRIADYYAGKILTWVKAGSPVDRGQKLGMITWGSQTDLFIESFPGLTITAREGCYVYGGETILARY